MASATVTAGSSDFSINQQFFYCAGQPVYPGNSCGAYVMFAPSAAGYRTGAVTFVDGNGVNYVAPLAGYGEKELNRTSLFPAALLPPSVSLATAANSPSSALVRLLRAAVAMRSSRGSKVQSI